MAAAAAASAATIETVASRRFAPSSRQPAATATVDRAMTPRMAPAKRVEIRDDAAGPGAASAGSVTRRRRSGLFGEEAVEAEIELQQRSAALVAGRAKGAERGVGELVRA